MNNAIGIFNMKYFVLFLVYTWICCVYSSSLVLATLYNCTLTAAKADALDLQLPPERSCDGLGVLTMVSLVLCFTFGNFVAILFWEAFACLIMRWGSSPGTKIDRLKGVTHQKPLPKINEVFGERTRCYYLWAILPVPTLFAERNIDTILGYTSGTKKHRGASRTDAKRSGKKLRRHDRNSHRCWNGQERKYLLMPSILIFVHLIVVLGCWGMCWDVNEPAEPQPVKMIYVALGNLMRGDIQKGHLKGVAASTRHRQERRSHIP